jgi:hypothetical protein
MKINKIICLFSDDNEKYFFQKAHSHYLINIPLYFVSSIDELIKSIDEKSFIVLSVSFTDKNISSIKQLLNEQPNFIFNFYHHNSMEFLPINVLDLRFDYSKQTTKPESNYFLMEQFKKSFD